MSVWTVRRDRLERTWARRAADVSAVAFDADGRWVVAASGETGAVRRWRVSAGRAAKALRGGIASATSLAFDRSGRTLVAAGVGRAGTRGVVRRWRWPSAAPLATLHPRGGSVLDVEVAGGQVAVAGADGAVRRFSLRTGRPLGPPLAGHTGSAQALALSPDGRALVSGGEDGTVRGWDLRARDPLVDAGSAAIPGVGAVAVASDATIAIALGDGRVRQLDGDGRGGRRCDHGPITTLATSSGARAVACVERGGRIAVSRAGHRRIVGRMTGPDAELALSPDGRTLAATGLFDGRVRLIDAGTGRTTTVERSTSAPATLAFSPDGGTLAAGRRDGSVTLWDVRHESRPPVVGRVLGSAVHALAFAPDGAQLAVGGDRGQVSLWSVIRRRPVASIAQAHAAPLVALAFDRRGRTLASAAADGWVSLRDATTGMPLGAPLDAGRSPVALAFDGRGALVAVGAHGDVTRWTRLLTSTDVGAWSARVAEVTGRAGPQARRAQR